MRDKSSKSVQVLSIELHVIVACSLHPQWVNCAGSSLVHCEAVGEINDFVFSPVND